MKHLLKILKSAEYAMKQPTKYEAKMCQNLSIEKQAGNL